MAEEVERFNHSIVDFTDGGSEFVSQELNCRPFIATGLELHLRRNRDVLTGESVEKETSATETGSIKNKDNVEIKVKNLTPSFEITTEERSNYPLPETIDLLNNKTYLYTSKNLPSNAETNTEAFWKSGPQPVPQAVNCYYRDISNLDKDNKLSAVWVDHFYLDSLYGDQVLNLYYSTDDTEGTSSYQLLECYFDKTRTKDVKKSEAGVVATSEEGEAFIDLSRVDLGPSMSWWIGSSFTLSVTTIESFEIFKSAFFSLKANLTDDNGRRVITITLSVIDGPEIISSPFPLEDSENLIRWAVLVDSSKQTKEPGVTLFIKINGEAASDNYFSNKVGVTDLFPDSSFEDTDYWQGKWRVQDAVLTKEYTSQGAYSLYLKPNNKDQRKTLSLLEGTPVTANPNSHLYLAFKAHTSETYTYGYLEQEENSTNLYEGDGLKLTFLDEDKAEITSRTVPFTGSASQLFPDPLFNQSEETWTLKQDADDDTVELNPSRDGALYLPPEGNSWKVSTRISPDGIYELGHFFRWYNNYSRNWENLYNVDVKKGDTFVCTWLEYNDQSRSHSYPLMRTKNPESVVFRGSTPFVIGRIKGEDNRLWKIVQSTITISQINWRPDPDSRFGTARATIGIETPGERIEQNLLKAQSNIIANLKVERQKQQVLDTLPVWAHKEASLNIPPGTAFIQLDIVDSHMTGDIWLDEIELLLCPENVDQNFQPRGLQEGSFPLVYLTLHNLLLNTFTTNSKDIISFLVNNRSYVRGLWNNINTNGYSLLGDFRQAPYMKALINQGKYERKSWTPILANYDTSKGFKYFPSPILAKYIKLEFTNLTPEPYPLDVADRQVSYQEYPSDLYTSIQTSYSPGAINETPPSDTSSYIAATTTDQRTSYDLNLEQVPMENFGLKTGEVNSYPLDTALGVESTFSGFYRSQQGGYKLNKDTTYTKEDILPSTDLLVENGITDAIGQDLDRVEVIENIGDIFSNTDLINKVTELITRGSPPLRYPEALWLRDNNLLVSTGDNAKFFDNVQELKPSGSSSTTYLRVEGDNTVVTTSERVRFPKGLHVYSNREQAITTGVAYYSGLREVNFYRSNYRAPDDTLVYNYPSFGPESDWVISNGYLNENNIVVPDGEDEPCLIESKQFLSHSRFKTVKFISFQREGALTRTVSLLEDLDLWNLTSRDPRLQINWEDLQWTWAQGDPDSPLDPVTQLPAEKSWGHPNLSSDSSVIVEEGDNSGIYGKHIYYPLNSSGTPEVESHEFEVKKGTYFQFILDILLEETWSGELQLKLVRAVNNEVIAGPFSINTLVPGQIITYTSDVIRVDQDIDDLKVALTLVGPPPVSIWLFKFDMRIGSISYQARNTPEGEWEDITPSLCSSSLEQRFHTFSEFGRCLQVKVQLQEQWDWAKSLIMIPFYRGYKEEQNLAPSGPTSVSIKKPNRPGIEEKEVPEFDHDEFYTFGVNVLPGGASNMVIWTIDRPNECWIDPNLALLRCFSRQATPVTVTVRATSLVDNSISGSLQIVINPVPLIA
jgi:hypothetical protein